MPSSDRDQINSAMGGSQDPNQDVYQQSMGGGQYGAFVPVPPDPIVSNQMTAGGVPMTAGGVPMTAGVY